MQTDGKYEKKRIKWDNEKERIKRIEHNFYNNGKSLNKSV